MLKEICFHSIQAQVEIMDEIQTNSLEQHENVIDAWVKEKNATMIYWHHGIKIWEYLLDCE